MLSRTWWIAVILLASGKSTFLLLSCYKMWILKLSITDFDGRIYVDCVFNQMTPGSGTGIGGSPVDGGSMSYPGNWNLNKLQRYRLTLLMQTCSSKAFPTDQMTLLLGQAVQAAQVILKITAMPSRCVTANLVECPICTKVRSLKTSQFFF